MDFLPIFLRIRDRPCLVVGGGAVVTSAGGSGGGGGGGGNPDEHFGYAINYDGGLPEGPITVTVSSIGMKYTQRLQAQWTPPAASTNPLPTQPAACLTAASWKTALAQKPALPKDISGRVLTSGLVTASFFVMGISVYHLLRRSSPEVFRRSFQIGATLGLIGAVVLTIIGQNREATETIAKLTGNRPQGWKPATATRARFLRDTHPPGPLRD